MFVAAPAAYARRRAVVVKISRAERTANRQAREELSRMLARDYVETIDSWRSNIDIHSLETRIAIAGGTGLVENALGIEELQANLGVAISPAIREAIVRGGKLGARFAGVQGVSVPGRVITDAAARWMQVEGARRVAGINDSTRRAVTGIVERSLRDEISPQAAATQIGRAVGLDERRARALRNFEEKLIRRRIPTPEVDTQFQREAIAQEVERYRDRLLRDRGRAIAETETQNAIMEGEREFWTQAIGTGQVADPDLIQKRWFTVADDRVCPRCEPLHGKIVGINELFDGVTGPPLHTRCRCYLEFAPNGFGPKGEQKPPPPKPPPPKKPPPTPKKPRARAAPKPPTVAPQPELKPGVELFRQHGVLGPGFDDITQMPAFKKYTHHLNATQFRQVKKDWKAAVADVRSAVKADRMPEMKHLDTLYRWNHYANSDDETWAKLISDCSDLGHRGFQKLAFERGIKPPGGTWKFNHFYFDHNDAIEQAWQELNALGFDKASLQAHPYTQTRELMATFKERLKELNATNRLRLGDTRIVDKMQFDPKVSPVLKQRIRRTVREFINRDLGAANLFESHDFTWLRWDAESGARAYARRARPRNRKTNIVMLSLDDSEGTIAHEFGHHIEFNNPAVAERVRQWRDSRSKGRGQKATVIYRGSKEKGYQDRFYEHYVGKVYEDGSTEVLSMGIETFYEENSMYKILKRDPDHFALIWSVLRGY